jgi:hypothetical protein
MTAVVKPSGGCRDGFGKADRTAYSKPPSSPPLSKGGRFSSNVVPQRGMNL